MNIRYFGVLEILKSLTAQKQNPINNIQRSDDHPSTKSIVINYSKKYLNVIVCA